MSEEKQILITPEKAVKAITEGNEARRLRDQSIINMHLSDPGYWTLTRLAKYWKTQKQNIRRIFDQYGIP